MSPQPDDQRAAREPIFSNLPPATALMVVVLVLAHLAFSSLGRSEQNELLFQYAVIPIRFIVGTPDSYASMGDALAALVGSAFLHGGWMHLAFNVAMLMQVGGLAEAGLRRSDRGGTAIGGSLRFLAFFIVCAIGGSLLFVGLNVGGVRPAIGASGAISGIFAGYLWTAFLATRGAAGGWNSILTQGGIFLALNVGVAALASGTGIAPIAWQAHLGGFIAGGLTFPLLMRHARP